MYIEGSARGDAKTGLNRGRRCREGIVRSGGGKDDQVDLVGRDAGMVERRPGGGNAKACRRLPRPGDPPLANAGSLDDPCIAGVDHPCKIVIGQHPLGKRRPHPFNDRPPPLHFQTPAPASATGPGESVDFTAMSAAIFSTMRFSTMSTATSIADAKPKASVPP